MDRGHRKSSSPLSARRCPPSHRVDHLALEYLAGRLLPRLSSPGIRDVYVVRRPGWQVLRAEEIRRRHDRRGAQRLARTRTFGSLPLYGSTGAVSGPRRSGRPGDLSHRRFDLGSRLRGTDGVLDGVARPCDWLRGTNLRGRRRRFELPRRGRLRRLAAPLLPGALPVSLPVDERRRSGTRADP